MKTEEQRRARKLRAQGWSINEIQAELGVSKSSVSVWVRNVILGEAQWERLVRRNRLGVMVTAERKRVAARAVRMGYQDEGRRLVRERGLSYVAGCMLYWAEGSKTRNSVQMSNSDPELLVSFLAFLRSHFLVPDDRVAISCNLFADHLGRQREIETFWLEALRLPHTSLRKSMVNSYSKYSQKKRNNKLPYGTCKLTVHSTRIVQTIYGSIQEYGRFERPEWLD